MRVVLTPKAWSDLRAAYERGASAGELSRAWGGVSRSTIYRHAVAGGWSKRAPARDHVESAPAVASADDYRRRRRPPHDPDDGADFVTELWRGEQPEPGILARMATTASGRAFMSGEFEPARRLVRLADDYARLAERGRTTNLHTVMRAMTDRPFADSLFKIAEGEYNVTKEIYWETMKLVDAEMAADAPPSEGAPSRADAR